jgi:hypothetical protein
MAERTVYDCDHCEAENVKVKRFPIEVDRIFDGVESGPAIDDVDLCIDCMAIVIKRHLVEMDYNLRRDFVKEFKRIGG